MDWPEETNFFAAVEDPRIDLATGPDETLSLEHGYMSNPMKSIEDCRIYIEKICTKYDFDKKVFSIYEQPCVFTHKDDRILHE